MCLLEISFGYESRICGVRLSEGKEKCAKIVRNYCNTIKKRF